MFQLRLPVVVRFKRALLEEEPMKDEHFERLKNDILYRFFTNQIYKIESEIKDNSQQIKKLTDAQIVLKRGRAEMVKLRRELDRES